MLPTMSYCFDKYIMYDRCHTDIRDRPENSRRFGRHRFACAAFSGCLRAVTVFAFASWLPEQGRQSMPSWRDKLALTAQRNRQEIVRAQLSRREMARLGLLTAAGTLIAKPGL